MTRRSPRKKTASRKNGRKQPAPATAAAVRLHEPQATTVVHDAPGRDGNPAELGGDRALPGSDTLSFAELCKLANMAGIDAPPGAEEILEGVMLTQEIAAAKERLAEAEENGEGPLEMGHAFVYLDQVHKALGRQVKRTRERAEELFADAQLAGRATQLEVMVDDGGPAAATLHIQPPKPQITWDMEEVQAYCARHAPTELYQEALPGVLALPDVLAFVLMTHPEYVTTKVRDAYLTCLQSEIDEQGHKVFPDTGELVKLATITRPVRNGTFTTRYSPASSNRDTGKNRIEALFRQGAMGDVLALGAGPEPDPNDAQAEES